MQASQLLIRCLLLSAFVASPLIADDGNPAYTDPAKAGKDFEIQGEYLHQIDPSDPKTKIGFQVIARGDSKFDIVAYIGGLPGDGWSRGDEMAEASGEMKDGKLEFVADNGTAVYDDGVLIVSDLDGNVIGRWPKVERKSPTLGKPPKGAIVLFDGSTADNFENGKIVEENLLGATGCTSKEKLGDHTLHIEFRTPFMPKSSGQARGNSGVYMQSRYEVQVLDSFGLDGKNNECGGIYQIAEPIVNMCLPPLSWQTYDIDFTAAKYDDDGKKTENARATIRHNGVVIHDDLELPNGTPGRLPEADSLQGLFLQNHGNPVAFRNIWVIKK